MSDEKAKPKAAAGGRSGAAGASLAKRDEANAEEERKPGVARWVLGWIVLPGVVIGGIFGGGALVGAHFHDSWFTRAIVWTVDLF